MYMYNNVCLNIFVVFVIMCKYIVSYLWYGFNLFFNLDLILYVSYGFKICLVFYFLIWCVLRIVCVLMYIVNDK